MEPYLENDIPVLFIQINIEEMVFKEIGQYQGFSLSNIESSETQIPKNLVKKEIKADKKEFPKVD